MNIIGNLRRLLKEVFLERFLTKKDNYRPSILGGSLTHSCMVDSAISSLIFLCKLHLVYLLNSNTRFVKINSWKVQQLFLVGKNDNHLCRWCYKWLPFSFRCKSMHPTCWCLWWYLCFVR